MISKKPQRRIENNSYTRDSVCLRVPVLLPPPCGWFLEAGFTNIPVQTIPLLHNNCNTILQNSLANIQLIEYIVIIMLQQSELEQILDFFPLLREADDKIRHDFSSNAAIREFPAGNIIYRSGDQCKYFALILSGTIRVFQVTESGSEVTYYRVGEADSCVLTASCLMHDTTFPAIASVEKTVTAAVVPSSIVREWTRKHEVWNKYILSLMAERMSKVAETMSHIAFCNSECKVATVLLKKSMAENPLRVTHNEIALEIGSAREVVSRILKEFEKKGMVSLSRNTIAVIDTKGLKIQTKTCG